MFECIRIAGLSALLAAGIVAVIEVPQARGTVPSGKIFVDRLQPSEPGAAARRYAPPVGAETADLVDRRGPAGSGRGDRLRNDPIEGCAAQTWPNIDRDCLIPVEGTPIRKAVRTITIETREGSNVSVLARVPVTEIARR